jgi:hypothetical protein
LGNFWKFIEIFPKDEVARRNGNILGYFFAQVNLLHFHLNKQFQNMAYLGVFRFQNWFDLDVLDLQI